MTKWPELLEQQLLTLSQDDRLTAAEIAKIMGVSRNAVLGKLHRMDRKRDPVLRVKARRYDLNYRLPGALDAEPGRFTMMQLGPHNCAYPMGEAPYEFCGRRVKGGSAYCPTHHSACYTKRV